jgi:DNA replication protein DnaD
MFGRTIKKSNNFSEAARLAREAEPENSEKRLAAERKEAFTFSQLTVDEINSCLMGLLTLGDLNEYSRLVIKTIKNQRFDLDTLADKLRLVAEEYHRDANESNVRYAKLISIEFLTSFAANLKAIVKPKNDS